MAVSYAVLNILLAYPDFAIPFRLIDLKPLEYWNAIRIPVGYCLVMTGGALGLRFALVWLGVTNPAVILTATSVGGAAIYIGALLSRRPGVVLDIFSLTSEMRLPGRRRRAAVVA